MNRLIYLALLNLVCSCGLWAQNAPQELNEAIRLGDLGAIEAILAQGAGFDAPWGDAYPPLHVAADRGQVEILRLLLRAGAPVNGRSRANRSSWDTALHQAVQREQDMITVDLLAAGADVDAQDRFGLTALHLAVDQRSMDFVLGLLEYHANPNLQDLAGVTPLYAAIQRDHNDIVEALLRAGADVNVRTHKGDSVLNLALRKGNVSLVECLLRFNGNVNLRGLHGETPLHCALRLGFHGLAAKFLKLGADVNAQDDQGLSPLHIAVDQYLCEGNIDVVQYVLHFGANPEVPDVNGVRPLDLAIRGAEPGLYIMLHQARVQNDLENAPEEDAPMTEAVLAEEDCALCPVDPNTAPYENPSVTVLPKSIGRRGRTDHNPSLTKRAKR